MTQKKNQEVITKTPINSMLYFGVQKQNEAHLKRLFDSEQEDMNEYEKMMTKTFLFDLYRSKKELSDFYTEASLKFFTKEMFLRFTSLAEFRKHMKCVLGNVLRPFSDEVYVLHWNHWKCASEKKETTLLRTYVVQELLEVFEAIFMGRKKLVFFETLIDQIETQESLSPDVADKVCKLMRKESIAFERGNARYFKKMLKEKKTPQKRSKKEWHDMVSRVMENTFKDDEKVAQRMTEYSVGRFVEASDSEVIQLDLSIPYDLGSSKKQSVHQLGSKFLGVYGKVSVKRFANGKGGVLAKLRVELFAQKEPFEYGRFFHETLQITKSVSDTVKGEIEPQIIYTTSNNLFENKTEADICAELRIALT